MGKRLRKILLTGALLLAGAGIIYGQPQTKKESPVWINVTQSDCSYAGDKYNFYSDPIKAKILTTMKKKINIYGECLGSLLSYYPYLENNVELVKHPKNQIENLEECLNPKKGTGWRWFALNRGDDLGEWKVNIAPLVKNIKSDLQLAKERKEKARSNYEKNRHKYLSYIQAKDTHALVNSTSTLEESYREKEKNPNGMMRLETIAEDISLGVKLSLNKKNKGNLGEYSRKVNHEVLRNIEYITSYKKRIMGNVYYPEKNFFFRFDGKDNIYANLDTLKVHEYTSDIEILRKQYDGEGQLMKKITIKDMGGDGLVDEISIEENGINETVSILNENKSVSKKEVIPKHSVIYTRSGEPTYSKGIIFKPSLETNQLITDMQRYYEDGLKIAKTGVNYIEY